MKAEEFTEELYGKLRLVLDSIQSEMQLMLHGNLPEPQRTKEFVDEDGLFSD